MTNKIIAEKYFGILATVDWNSNQWQAESTEDDLKNSNFGFTKEHGITYTSLNFAHEIYPTDENDYYAGLLPQLWTKTPDKENAKLVKIVFIKAKNWEDKKNYIVGFYAFPIFEKGKKPSPIASFTEDFETNIKALPKDIHILKNYILFEDEDVKKFIPKGKKVGLRGFNYLEKDNVYSILDRMSSKNSDVKLQGIKYRIIKTIDAIER